MALGCVADGFPAIGGPRHAARRLECSTFRRPPFFDRYPADPVIDVGISAARSQTACDRFGFCTTCRASI
jgi:hypothetical protein